MRKLYPAASTGKRFANILYRAIMRDYLHAGAIEKMNELADLFEELCCDSIMAADFCDDQYGERDAEALDEAAEQLRKRAARLLGTVQEPPGAAVAKALANNATEGGQECRP